VAGTAATSFTQQAGTTILGGTQGGIRADAITLNGVLNVAGTAAAGTAAGGYSQFSLAGSNITLGGTALLNTYLNNGATQLTDRINVNLYGGATSGTERLAITNTGGRGAMTVGDGIEVVDAQNGSTSGAFALAAPIVHGPYSYGLYQGGADNAASKANNWYLRSDLRADLSLYAAMPAMALGWDKAILDTLHERMGEEAPGLSYNNLGIDGDNGNNGGFRPTLGWVRVLHPEGKSGDPTNGINGTGGARTDWRMTAIQGGIDLYRGRNDKGDVNHIGLYGVSGTMTSNVLANNRNTHTNSLAGRDDMDAHTLGAYWTHYWNNGAYVDALAQYTWSKITGSPVPGIPGVTGGASTHGRSFAASIEAGKPYHLTEHTVLEPQAQLVYVHGKLDSLNASGVDVSFDKIDSLDGRLGVRLAYTRANDSKDPKKQSTLWIQPSIRHEFLSRPTITFSAPDSDPYTVTNDMRDTSWEVAAGVDVPLTKHVNLYFSGLYNKGINGSSKYDWAWAAKAGLRVQG
jgi:fibronectin-binding autotransporter adhesin